MTYNFDCESGGGAVFDGAVDDSGELEIAIDPIVDQMEELENTPPCQVVVELSRVRDGDVDGFVEVDSITGIERRAVSFELSE